MGEVVHTARIKIVRDKGPTRRTMIEAFQASVLRKVLSRNIARSSLFHNTIVQMEIFDVTSLKIQPFSPSNTVFTLFHP